LPVDWNAVALALRDSHDGHNLKALAALSAIMPEAETDSDRAAIALGQSSCYSQLGNLAKSHELLESARIYSFGDRGLTSQVEMSEGSLYAQEKKYNLACEKFAQVKSDYQDLLAQPEHDDFALELNSRLGCVLVDAGKFNEAIPIFAELFKREQLDDRQRLEVYFAVALIRTGQPTEAQHLFFAAAKGENSELSQIALKYLSQIEQTHTGRQSSRNIIDDGNKN
jgi:tetratricopeptide (TPR) repeat protein